MKRRRLIIGFALAAFVVIAAAAIWHRTHSPCLATFKKVQPGMTRAEVYATVGGPPGNYTGGKLVDIRPNPGLEFWAARDSLMFVSFDANDRATTVAAAPTMGHFSGGPSLFQRISTAIGF
jgi:hypothetical protein